jgi:hypothetical protein
LSETTELFVRKLASLNGSPGNVEKNSTNQIHKKKNIPSAGKSLKELNWKKIKISLQKAQT